jgi:hypothetical protein
VCYNDFSIKVIFLVGAFLGVGRTPVATSKPADKLADLVPLDPKILWHFIFTIITPRDKKNK